MITASGRPPENRVGPALADRPFGHSSYGALSADWVKCTGLTNANAFDLFRAIDGATVQPGIDVSPACLPGDVEREVREARAAPNLRVAAENLPLATAWVALVDHELSEASRLGL